MTLAKQSWWPKAEDLQLGQKRRTSHDCGEGTTLLVSRDSKGYHAWCFRCNDDGWGPPGYESSADKLARIAALSRGDASLGQSDMAGSLPVPQVHEVSRWPDGAALWLYKAGLSKADIGRLGVYYHPPSDRVVLPVSGPHTPLYYQARAFQAGRMPKYLGPTPKPRKLLAQWGSAPSPTLTEDILSAMKVGLVGEGIAVCGTLASDHLIAYLLKRKAPVNVWLDPDAAGRKGAAKLCKQLRAYGLAVRNIQSLRDPKLHSRSEIKEYLDVP